MEPSWSDDVDGNGGLGSAYDPTLHPPLLVPTTGMSGPNWPFEDFVCAVEKARDGKITVFTFHGVPDLDHHFVNTEPDTKDNKTRQALPANAGVDDWAHEPLSNEPSPEESTESGDQIARLESLLEDDEEAYLVFLCMQEGAKSREIAEELDKPVTEIYVIKKRIRRKLKELRTDVK